MDRRRAVIYRRATGYWRTMSFVLRSVAIASVACAMGAHPARAQVTRDTTVAPVPKASAVTRLSPPLTPRRAFLYSLAVPGYGQSRLDRGTSGALFASLEITAIAMVRRSKADLQEVRRYRIDTLPSDFVVSGSTLTKTGIFTNRYSAELEKTRKLHVEDWMAVLFFNHLFSGADAFVGAQLWDVPISLTAMPRADGAVVVATVRW